MPVMPVTETVSSAVGWSTQSLQLTDTSHAGRMQSVNVGSLSESSSSMASEPVNDLLAQPSELLLLLLFGFRLICMLSSSCE